jgi:hypothetical protein
VVNCEAIEPDPDVRLRVAGDHLSAKLGAGRFGPCAAVNRPDGDETCKNSATPPDSPIAGLPCGIDYSAIFSEPSGLEQAFAVFGNVLRMDDQGNVVNARQAEERAAQWIRQYVQEGYLPDPPLEAWEMELPSPE